MKRITAEDPESRSPDLVADNITRLARLFPEAFTDGKVNFAVLRELLGDAIDETEEKYGLSWHGKRRARRRALTPSAGTLRPCPEESVEWDSTQNLVIEGDNLEVLKLLQRSYTNKVKLIYIDPPYNTGKDFVYRDNHRDGIRNYLKITGQLDGNGDKLCSNTDASGRFHTNWLNMMYPRLKLARVLLRQDGFLFMTVDDAEVHHLRQIADEVFGEENFVANVVWEKKYTRANDAQFFSDNHDHVLIFAKNRSDSKLSLQGRTVEQEKAYSNPDNHPKGPWKATPLHAKSGGNSRPYTFRNGVTWAPPPGTYRRFSDQTMNEMDGRNEIWFGSDGLATPSRKTFLSDAKSGVSPVTIWPYKETGHNHEANNELKQLLFRNEELIGYLKNTMAASRSVYDHVVYDSGNEAAFAASLEQFDAVKVYAKLPRWFQVPTPLGPYNPDWAVLIKDDGGERLYLVVETKGSAFLDDLRNAERAKVECGKAHFEALQVGESPARYRVVHTADELLA